MNVKSLRKIELFQFIISKRRKKSRENEYKGDILKKKLKQMTDYVDVSPSTYVVLCILLKLGAFQLMLSFIEMI